jgi:hypothetical protein
MDDREKHAFGPRPDGWLPVFMLKQKMERDDDSKKGHRALDSNKYKTGRGAIRSRFV